MSKHFELTDETITTHFGRTLRRIRATRDLSQHGVKVGDLGGFVESEDNLAGNAWVTSNARVSGDAQVTGDARVSGNAWVTSSRHVLTLSPIGAENQTVTLCKTTTGHTLHVGCWTGTADTLMEEVARRREKYWGDNEHKNQALTSEYKAVLTLVWNRIKEWEAEK